MTPIKFRAKCIARNDWVYGDYHKSANAHHISWIDDDGDLNISDVYPHTISQLRYVSPDGTEYYDGDIYYHAGHGHEEVSAICELQHALYVGNSEDIGQIITNIYDNETDTK